ncbi:MAG: ATP-binding domain-containing protein, partial [Balneolales bacterium]|nr:ATP-binding domain-containing protein [Balneolales bacterium]
EASMLDISLWITLIRAVTEKTKLVLMGDPHQLASVEAGSILGDICSQASNSFSQEMALKLEIENNDDSTPDFNDSIINLTKSYRFSENSGIKSISDAINEGDSEKVIELLESKEFPELVWVEPSGTTINQLIEKFSVVPYTQLLNDGFSSETLNEYQILTAYRKGPFGNEYINLKSEQRIKSANNIDIDTVWFDGRSVIATRNNHTLGIKNGEIGIYDASRGLIKFEGKEEDGISISRLTHYEPSQSITIHKSQGSEYRNVAIVLPMAENELLTKELLYTAVTRARESILVVGKRKTIIDTVRQSIDRKSGLIKKIWE